MSTNPYATPGFNPTPIMLQQPGYLPGVPAQTPGTAGTGFNAKALFTDPNFLNLIAGIGASLDPEGVAGGLAKATQGFIAAKGAQRTAAAQQAQQTSAHQQWVQSMQTALGGQTPGGTPGIDDTKLNPDGSVTFKVAPPTALRPGGIADTPTMLQQPGYIAPGGGTGTTPSGTYSTTSSGSNAPASIQGGQKIPFESLFPL